MPLQLIITDPHNLTEQERMAVLTFCGVRVTERDVSKIARSEPRDSVREVIADITKTGREIMLGMVHDDALAGMVAAAVGRGEPITVDDGAGNVARGEVRIDPLDDPSAGVVPVPPVPGAIDAAAIFGKGATVPSVPIPPVPAAPAVPSAASVTPAASVPSAGASDALPPAAPPNPSNALDTAGMPWDHRIHATTKTKNGDGTWRMKRGVDEKLVADVVEQNKRLMAIAPPAVTVPTAPDVPVPPGAAELTFLELMEQVTKLILAGKISVEAANAACMPVGCTFLHQLDKRPDLIPAAWVHIKQAAGVQ